MGKPYRDYTKHDIYNLRKTIRELKAQQEVVNEACARLESVCKHTIAHTDIKPENKLLILLDNVEQAVRVCTDF